MTPEEILHLLRLIARQDILIDRLRKAVEDREAEIARLQVELERLSE